MASTWKGIYSAGMFTFPPKGKHTYALCNIHLILLYQNPVHVYTGF